MAFILRGNNRRRIYRLLLASPRTISGISAVTGIYITNVSRVIKEFEEKGLVVNKTPIYMRGCVYQLTSLALELQEEFEEYWKFSNRQHR